MDGATPARHHHLDLSGHHRALTQSKLSTNVCNGILLAAFDPSFITLAEDSTVIDSPEFIDDAPESGVHRESTGEDGSTDLV